ncbi:unnamed protein product [Durusdinium trenchii]|uniref:Mannosyltransferase n=1 Tax=Durusdinium trenchii TaxID=1381693 RepID=A0ABP0HFU6_9DINO
MGKMSFKDACCTPDLWWSFLFRLLGVLMWWKAGCLAPVTTVAPLFLLVSLFSNMVAGPALLQEQYRSREVYLSLSLLALVLLGAYLESQIIKKSSAQKLSIWLVNMRRLQQGEISAIAFCLAILLLFFGYYGWIVINYTVYQRERFNSDMIPFDFYSQDFHGYSTAIPVISGLLSGVTYFEGYLGLPVCNVLENRHVDVKQTALLLLCIAPVAVLSFAFSIEGARRWDCRYFVPFSSTVGYLVASSIRVLLVTFQGHGLNTSPAELLFCLFIHVVLVGIPLRCIDRRPVGIQLPHTLKKEAPSTPYSNPLAIAMKQNAKSHGTVDHMELRKTPWLEMEIGKTTPLLEIEETQGSAMLQSFERIAMLKVKVPDKEWPAWIYDVFCNVGSLVPATIVIIGVLPLPIFLFLVLWQKLHSEWLLCIAVYCAIITGTTNLRTAVFSSVARWRTRLCLKGSYMTLLQQEGCVDAPTRFRRVPKRFGGGRKVIMGDPWESASSSSEDETVPWEAVQHFVVVETGLCTSCDKEEICSLLESVSASSMAPKQVSVFFVLKDSKEAKLYEAHLPEWNRNFARKLKTIELLNLELEVNKTLPLKHKEQKPPPHRSQEALVSWLLNRGKTIKASDHLILVTRTTVDSWFHPEYFPAVTFAFLNTGAKRNFTIYQPPILFLKDYSEQNWLTRYACLFLAQSSLASLTDPMGMPLPKSTFTMVMALMGNVDHSWDPGLAIRPYNIGIWTKCWIGTIGRMNLQPMFLPVYRSGCNPVLDDTFVREPRLTCLCFGATMHGPLRAQVLSVLELVHMWAALPLAWCSRRESPLQKRRIFSLMCRSLLPFGSVFWAHWVLCTWFVVVSLNVLSLLHSSLSHWPPPNTGPQRWDFAFLFGVTAAAFNLPLFSVFSNVDLLKLYLASCPPSTSSAKSPPSTSSGERSLPCQGLILLLTSFVAGPLFFLLSFIEEFRLAFTLKWAAESS